MSKVTAQKTGSLSLVKEVSKLRSSKQAPQGRCCSSCRSCRNCRTCRSCRSCRGCRGCGCH